MKYQRLGGCESTTKTLKLKMIKIGTHCRRNPTSNVNSYIINRYFHSNTNFSLLSSDVSIRG